MTYREGRMGVAALLGRILSAFGPTERGVCIMDEVDLVLHPLHSELNFPLGEKRPLAPAPERWGLPLHLIDALVLATTGSMADARFLDYPGAKAVADDIKAALELGVRTHAVAFKPHLLLLDKGFFAAKLARPMALWLLPWLRLKQDGLANLTDAAILGIILDYEVEREAVDAIGPDAMQLLNAAHTWLSSLLAHCLSKASRVSYGLLQAADLAKLGGAEAVSYTRQIVAVPFKGKDAPSPAAEFAHPDVLIGLTILAYWHEGVRMGDLQKLVARLKVDLVEEGGPIESRRATLLFRRWVEDGQRLAHLDGARAAGGDMLPTLELLQPADTAQFRPVWRLIWKSPGVISHLLSGFVFPEAMRAQSVKISASGQELGSGMVFGSRVGFSGTPSNMLPAELRPCHFERGSEGKIVHVLTDPKVVSAVRLTEAQASDAYALLRLLATASPPVHALIDVGALVIGPSNREAVEFMLEVGLNEMDAAVYLDEDDRQMVVFRGGGAPVPLRTTGIPWSRRFTLYDQVHTTGIDIKQAGTARAAITVNKDSILRDYAQGAWRMRGIAIGQTLQLLVAPSFEARIKQMLPKPTGNLCSDTVAMLVLQEQRVQNLQAAKLLEQDVRCAFRKRAYSSLLRISKAVDMHAFDGLQGGFPAVGAPPNDEWTLVLHHELKRSREAMFWPKDATAEQPQDLAQRGFGCVFSRLGELEQFANEDGSYELALQWPGGAADGSKDVHLHWVQTSSPLEPGAVEGYRRIDGPVQGVENFGGLRAAPSAGAGALLYGEAWGRGSGPARQGTFRRQASGVIGAKDVRRLIKKDRQRRARTPASGEVGSISYMGLWHDEGPRTFPPMPSPLPGCNPEEGGKFYWSRDVAASVQQLAARIAAEGQTVGYLGLQFPCGHGVAVFESVGPDEPFKRLGAGGAKGSPTSVQVAGFEGKITEQGGGWTNAVYKIALEDADDAERVFFFTSLTRARKDSKLAYPSELSRVTFLDQKGSEIAYSVSATPDWSPSKESLEILKQGRSWKDDRKMIAVPNHDTEPRLLFHLHAPATAVSEVHVYTTNDESFGDAPSFGGRFRTSSRLKADLFIHYEAEEDRVVRVGVATGPNDDGAAAVRAPAKKLPPPAAGPAGPANQAVPNKYPVGVKFIENGALPKFRGARIEDSSVGGGGEEEEAKAKKDSAPNAEELRSVMSGGIGGDSAHNEVLLWVRVRPPGAPLPSVGDADDAPTTEEEKSALKRNILVEQVQIASDGF